MRRLTGHGFVLALTVAGTWKSYGGAVKIPRGTRTITIRMQLLGRGEVWFDTIKVAYASDSQPADTPPPPARGGRRN